jgi:steroid delta-isomerase-like uncharacterized protein
MEAKTTPKPKAKPRPRSKKAINAAVARKSFDALAARDLDGIVADWSEEGVEDIVAFGILRGKTEIRENVRSLYASFPDLEFTFERVIADDRHATLQWRAAATFTGEPYMGILPNGKRVEVRTVEVMELEDGKIVRNTIYYDGAAFARQIGMLPEQESGAEKAMIAAFNTVTKMRKAIEKRKGSA